MTPALARVQVVTRTVLVPVLAFLAHTAKANLQVMVGNVWSHVILWSGVTLGFSLAETLINRGLTSRSGQPLRRRFLPEEFIEGYWVDAVYQENQVLFLGVSYFGYRGNAFILSGVNFSPDGGRLSSYTSELLDLRGNRLMFSYRWKAANMPGAGELGYGEYIRRWTSVKLFRLLC